VLLRFLHDTGEVFHRSGCFDDSIIVDQNWFIDALYRLFDRKSGTYDLARKHGGRLHGVEAKLFWPDVDANEHQTYFDFMIRTGMAFEPNHDHRRPFAERELVVPALLPTADAPSLASALDHWDEVAEGERWLRLEYPFLHRGVIERIIVELSSLSDARTWWRDGIVVRDPATKGSILFEASIPDSHLDIRFRKGQPSESFARVCAFLEKHHEWPPTRILASTNGKTFVDLAHVEDARRQGQQQVRSTTNSDEPRAIYDDFLPRSKPAGELVSDPPATKPPIQIFISYAHKDEAYKDELETRLRGLRHIVPIDFWTDREILAGAEWEEDILKKLDVADIVILLISPDFMGSSYCFSLELTKALAKYKAGRGIPVPIIVRPEVTWTRLQIGQHQALPKNATAISEHENKDTAWANVTAGLLAVLENIHERNHSTPT